MKKIIPFFLSFFLLILNVFLFTKVIAAKKQMSKIPAKFAQTYCPTNASYASKEIIISLSNQSLAAYDENTLFLQTPVTSGGPQTPTPEGVYTVLEKLQGFNMHSPWPPSDWRWYPDTFVNFGLLFENDGYFIHDASWRDNFGPGSNSVFGTPGGSLTGSHGCVNVPLSAESALYSWATIGTTVIVTQ